MSIAKRLHYYNRIFSAYLTSDNSQLTFWHDTPEENLRATVDVLGEYYMSFSQKAHYTAHLDAAGIPMLDYRGRSACNITRSRSRNGVLVTTTYLVRLKAKWTKV